MRLLDVDTGRQSGLKYKLVVCHFELVVDMVGDGIREFVNYVNGPAFLEKGLMGFGVGGYQ